MEAEAADTGMSFLTLLIIVVMCIWGMNTNSHGWKD